LKKSNLEKIKGALEIGWAAQFRESIEKALAGAPVHVVGPLRDGFLLSDGNIVDEARLELMEITQFLYAGQLAGNMPIEIGQKFRVKATGEVGEAMGNEMSPCFVSLKTETRGNWAYSKSDLEPIFD